MELRGRVLLGTAGRAIRSVSEWRVVSHLQFLVLSFLVELGSSLELWARIWT